MGDFRKNILQTDLEGEKLARIYLGKIISCTEKISLMTYIMLKKNLTPLYVRGRISNSRSLEKKFLPKLNHPYPLPTKVIWATTQGVGRKPANLTLQQMSSVNKMAGGVHHVVAFKTKVLHFKIENTPIKYKVERESSRVLRFLFVYKRELFALKLSFEEFNLVFFTADQSAWLVLNQPRQRGF